LRRVITRSGGFVVKYLGDGVLAYFGYPRAHEEDAEQAVRAGLALIESVGKLDASPRAVAVIGPHSGARGPNFTLSFHLFPLGCFLASLIPNGSALWIVPYPLYGPISFIEFAVVRPAIVRDSELVDYSLFVRFYHG
jgi:hypothetical protein